MALGKDGNSNVRNISEIRVGKYKTQLEGVEVIIYTEKITTFSLERRHEILKLSIEISSSLEIKNIVYLVLTRRSALVFALLSEEMIRHFN